VSAGGDAIAIELRGTPRGNTSGVSKDYATLLVALLLVVATLALYQHALQNSFVSYDDPAYVTRNIEVQKGLTGPSAVWAFTSTSEANWHPLTWLSHMADVQMYGVRPAGHHLTNILLHTLNVVLLFLLLRLGTGALWRSAMVAALFALHPLNVETVAWVAERKSLLSTLFMLLAIGAYGWYAKKPSVARYVPVALLFAMGLMAKPMIVTLPFALLLLDYWPLERMPVPASADGGSVFFSSLLKLLAEKIPLLLLSAGSIAITLYAQRQGGAVGSVLLLPLSQRINNAVYSYLAYLGKTSWPAWLAVFYPHPEGSLAGWKVLAAAIVFAAITFLVWRYRERRFLVAGWLWYLGTLVPVIGIVQVGRQAMADRYAYLPLLGIFVMIVWLAGEFVAQRAAAHAWLRSAAFLVGAAALGAYAAVSYTQIGYWQNSFTLFTHALTITPDNGIAEDNLGTALVNMGHPEQALPHLEAAVRLAPQLPSAHYNLAIILHGERQYARAASEYQIAMRTFAVPAEAAQAHNNLAVLYLQTNHIREALSEFDAAINLSATEQSSFIGRGSIELGQGRVDVALTDFMRATQIAPSPLAYFWLGQAFEAKGEAAAAVTAYENALRLAPQFVEAQTRLSILHANWQNASPPAATAPR
jgi:tetratricopeptide (TPR) repeat protein